MKFLYIFPHPDDESFGPVAAMYRQLQEGHEVHLLTLTKGGATRQRHVLGLSIDEMGDIRYKEMLKVKKTVGLSGMTVLDYPDGLLSEMDPRILEKTVKKHIHRLQPDIVVSYPVHGISGFHDHLVMHAVIKRVFLEMKEEGLSFFKRLAFITLKDSGAPAFQDGKIRLKQSAEEMIDCIYNLKSTEIDMLKEALSCYATYQSTIEESGVIQKIGKILYFEIFDEYFDPPLNDLTSKMPKG